VIPLKHARAGEVAAALRGLALGRRGQLFFNGVVRVTAFHHGNALLVTANARDALMLRRLVRKLDVPRRRVRLQVSLVEGRLTAERVGTSQHPTGRYLLSRQRVLDATTLLLADREEKAIPFSRSTVRALRCLWGGRPPRLTVRTRVAPRGRVELALSSREGRSGGPTSRKRAEIVLSVKTHRAAAVAFVPRSAALGLPPSFLLVAPRVTGFVVPNRCGTAVAGTRLLLITPTVIGG
jgi:hypothetical protein